MNIKIKGETIWTGGSKKSLDFSFQNYKNVSEFCREHFPQNSFLEFNIILFTGDVSKRRTENARNAISRICDKLEDDETLINSNQEQFGPTETSDSNKSNFIRKLFLTVYRMKG